MNIGQHERRTPTANRRLAQWRVTWLIEHSTSHQLLWCIDSFVLRNPPLRQAPKRYEPLKDPMEKIYTFLIIILLVSCKAETNSNEDSRIKPGEEERIIRMNQSDVLLYHNFPDTLNSGDKVFAEIESKNPDWKITRSFVYCPIDSDNVFRIYHRFKNECLELPVENSKAYIEFTTLGIGNKEFGTVTLVLENKDGIKKATELEFKYYLKEKNGYH
jgi:hypothetical protein